MPTFIALKLSDFYSFRGRIGRIDFILGIFLTGSVPAMLYYLFRNPILALGNDIYFFGFKALLQLMVLSLATPFHIKRFHDLNSSGYWVLIYWICLPFAFEVAYFLELMIGVQINPFNEFILFLGFIGLLMLLVLTLKKGNPEENQWGNPNKRMQAVPAKLGR